MNCCTPEYLKINISPIGDVLIQRGTGDAPSCGYYSNYSGDPSIGYLDYHEVDLKYDTGVGFWTLSGKTESFDDNTLYRLNRSGDPCNPIGSYTGGLYNVIVSASNKWNTYDFEKSFTTNSGDLTSIGIGSGIHKKKDVQLTFGLLDKKRQIIDSAASSQYVESINFDILDINGRTVIKDYIQGLSPSISITEQQNIEIFGEYKKDFGVRAKIIDDLGVVSNAEYYLYGNVLNIDSISVREKEGTTEWITKSYAEKEEEATSLGLSPSGYIDEEDPKISFKFSFDQNEKYVDPVSVQIYADTSEDFSISENTFIGDLSIQENLNASEVFLNDLIPNQNYWFKARANSALGFGNTVKFGPHKIFKKETLGDSTETYKFGIYDYKNKDLLMYQDFIVGEINQNIKNNSGVLDVLSIDLNKTGLGSASPGEYLYSGEKIYGYSLPIKENGKWMHTTFDYEFEFKNSSDEYQNISKNIKIIATGTSTGILNNGLPLFDLIDSNTGVPVEIAINYIPSGIEILANTGHSFDIYKYYKKSI